MYMRVKMSIWKNFIGDMAILNLACEFFFTLNADLSLLQRGALDTWRPAFFMALRVMPDRLIRIGGRAWAVGREIERE